MAAKQRAFSISINSIVCNLKKEKKTNVKKVVDYFCILLTAIAISQQQKYYA